MATNTIAPPGQMTIFDILDGEPFDDSKAHWIVSDGAESTYVMAIPPKEILTNRDCENWFENHRDYWYMHVNAVHRAMTCRDSWISAINKTHSACDSQMPVKMCVYRDSTELTNVVEYLSE